MNMNSDNGNNTTKGSTASANNERTLDPVNQVNSTGTPTDSLADLGNNVSSMAAESINGLKDKFSSISPGEVVDNVRGQIQSITTGQRDNNGESGEETLNKGLLMTLLFAMPCWYRVLTLLLRWP